MVHGLTPLRLAASGLKNTYWLYLLVPTLRGRHSISNPCTLETRPAVYSFRNEAGVVRRTLIDHPYLGTVIALHVFLFSLIREMVGGSCFHSTSLCVFASLRDSFFASRKAAKTQRACWLRDSHLILINLTLRRPTSWNLPEIPMQSHRTLLVFAATQVERRATDLLGSSASMCLANDVVWRTP